MVRRATGRMKRQTLTELTNELPDNVGTRSGYKADVGTALAASGCQQRQVAGMLK
jgi:hypothetical protein